MILSLITKYLNGEASEKEAAQVFEWIETSDENKKQFVTLKKTLAMSEVLDSDKKSTLKQLQESLNKHKSFNFSSLLKYAAILILFISIGSHFWLSEKQTDFEVKSVVLELEESNTKINLITDKPIIKNQLIDIITEQNENEIVYKNKIASHPITYHTLSIPYGKIFKVTLSDGSIAHLSAGSSLKYPKQFNETDNRKVFLKGEAFFEVKKDNKRPFIVEANTMNIKVLGTVFNVNTFKSKDNIDCVLVEGSVELSNKNNKVILKPNEKAIGNVSSKAFNISLVNTKLYTSWINGEFIFEDSNFKDISNKLTQFYNIKIENNSNTLKNQKFSGTINITNSSVETILDLLRIDTPFSYTKENNTIVISNNKS